MRPITPNDVGGVCCVIVNWNGWQDTLDCLSSLRTQDYPALEVIVVDNGSTNDSAVRIREAFPDVQVLETGANLGFARGTNAGLREGLKGHAEFFWLLNNDTICPEDTLSKLAGRARQAPDAGLIGTVLYYAHDPVKVQAWCGGKITPWLGVSTHFYTPTEVGHNCFTTFASALARRAMLEEVGLLYEGFFMYYDDGDFCLRMQKTHWKIAVAEDTAVLHKEAGSAPRGENPFMAQVVTVSGLRFIRRNSRLAFLGMPIFVALRLGRRIAKQEWRSLAAVWAGMLQYLREPLP